MAMFWASTRVNLGWLSNSVMSAAVMSVRVILPAARSFSRADLFWRSAGVRLTVFVSKPDGALPECAVIGLDVLHDPAKTMIWSKITDIKTGDVRILSRMMRCVFAWYVFAWRRWSEICAERTRRAGAKRGFACDKKSPGPLSKSRVRIRSFDEKKFLSNIALAERIMVRIRFSLMRLRRLFRRTAIARQLCQPQQLAWRLRGSSRSRRHRLWAWNLWRRLC